MIRSSDSACFSLFVPAMGASLGIDADSAIVGKAEANGLVQFYYEGNRFNAENLKS